MINKVNSTDCNFKANLKTTLKITDKAKFEEVKELFARGTKAYENETLYLTGTKNGTMSIHTSNMKSGDFYYGEEIFTSPLKEHLETMNARQLARKLINSFKVLRLSDQLGNKKAALSLDLKLTYDKYNKNKNISNTLRKCGKSNLAEKYDLFASFNITKIQKLNKEINEIKTKFYNQRTLLSKKFPEINQVEI